MIPHRFPRARLAAAAAALLLLLAPAAGAATFTAKKRTDFSQEIHPRVVAIGPDGKVWFADERYTPHSVGFFTPKDGKVSKFAIPCDGCENATNISYIESIVVGPDGNAWFIWTHVRSDGAPLNNGINSFVSKVTPAGVFTTYPIQTKDAFRRYVFATNSNSMITVGPDGNLWFTENQANGGKKANVGRITTAGVITEFAVPTDYSSPAGITAGPDGNVWFAEADGGKIARITTAGVITEFALPNDAVPYDIVSGPDGKLWFTDRRGRVGRITTSGAVTLLPLQPNSYPAHLWVASNGKIYVAFNTSTASNSGVAATADEVYAKMAEVTPDDTPFISGFTLVEGGVNIYDGDAVDDEQVFFVTVADFDETINGNVDSVWEITGVPSCDSSQFKFSPTSGPLPGGTVGETFEIQPFVAVEPDPPEVTPISLVGGTLPPGITGAYTSEEPAGFVLSGTPTQAGDYTFTLRAEVRLSDGTYCAITGTYTMHIEGLPAPEVRGTKAAVGEFVREGATQKYVITLEWSSVPSMHVIDLLPVGSELKSVSIKDTYSGQNVYGAVCAKGNIVDCTFNRPTGTGVKIEVEVLLPLGLTFTNAADLTATDTTSGVSTTLTVTAPVVRVLGGRYATPLTTPSLASVGERP